jgi:predicted PurR-regulated permease PerM
MARHARSQVSVKTAFTVSLTALAVGVGAWVVFHAPFTIGLTAGGLLIAVALDRGVSWLERHHVPRSLGIASVMTAVVAIIVGVAWLVFPPAINQGSRLLSGLPQTISGIRHSAVVEQLDRYVDVDAVLKQIEDRAPALVQGAITPALDVARTALHIAFALVTILFIALFALATGRPVVGALLDQAALDRRGRYERVLWQIRRAVGGYVTGLFLLVASNAVGTSIFLAIIGIPYFLALGVLAGTASVIPFAGAILAGTAISVVAWIAKGFWTGVVALAWFVAYQQFENHVLAPIVYRETVSLNPLVVVVVALLFAELGGIPGAMLAVPATAVAQIVLREIFRERRKRLGIPAPPSGGGEAQLPRPRGESAPPPDA